uniref:SH2 domain-containing protein n=1 Tax=Mesocestoides corti TaxID=53468 RepID=A0A5K3ERK7_MESCO
MWKHGLRENSTHGDVLFKTSFHGPAQNASTMMLDTSTNNLQDRRDDCFLNSNQTPSQTSNQQIIRATKKLGCQEIAEMETNLIFEASDYAVEQSLMDEDDILKENWSEPFTVVVRPYNENLRIRVLSR